MVRFKISIVFYGYTYLRFFISDFIDFEDVF